MPEHDIHLTAEALDARDVSDHGLLDYDPDDPRLDRAQEWAARNARAQPHGYAFWTPSPSPSQPGDPF